jgi:hypothetical protein
LKEGYKIIIIFLMLSLSSSLFTSITNNHTGQYELNSMENPPLLIESPSFKSWEPQVRKSIGTAPYSVYIGDANNDGFNDIVTANSADNNISILLWNHSIMDWHIAIELKVGASPRSVIIGDVNNDGFKDIVTANYNADNISILLWNDTLGDWDAQFTRSVGDQPNCVIIGDADMDGDMDIAVSNYGGGDISVLRWNESSNDWNLRTLGPYGIVASSVSLGDADNDGDNDLICFSDWGGIPVVSIIPWNNTGKVWESSISLPLSGDGSYWVTVGDANNNGFNDIVAVREYPIIYNTVIYIFTWNDTGKDWNERREKILSAYYARPKGICLGDANHDGFNDIVIAESGIDNVSLLCWNPLAEDWASGTDSWTFAAYRSVGDTPYSVVLGDANNDGFEDIVTANLNSDDISILLWNSTGWEEPVIKKVGSCPYSTFIGDANNDGFNDIVVTNANDNNISILLWDSNYNDWDLPITKAIGTLPCAIYLGDVNNDGYNDMVIGNYVGGGISILLWNDTATDWDAPLIKTTQASCIESIVINDANNDGENDIIVGGDSYNIDIYCWNVSSHDWDWRECNLDGPSNSIAVGDANNDGENDIIVADHYNEEVYFHRWNRTLNRWFREYALYTGDFPEDIILSDVDNDGDVDIITSNYGSGDISIFLWNFSAQTWDPAITKSVGEQPESVFAGDVDNDGDTDIVTANCFDDTISIFLWNTSASTWDPELARPVGYLPSSVIIGDANNDGLDDIVVGYIGTDNITIFCSDRRAGNWETPRTISMETPIKVCSGDINNDGSEDILTLNQDGVFSFRLWNTTLHNWNPPETVLYGFISFFLGDGDNNGLNDVCLVGREYETFFTCYYFYIDAETTDWHLLEAESINLGGDPVDPTDICVGDANNDGYDDIIVSYYNANSFQGYVNILLFDYKFDMGQWLPQWTATEKTVGQKPCSVAVGDIRTNGQNEIVVAYSGENSFSILDWNTTSEDWDLTTETLLETMFPSCIFIEDADNDGENEIVLGHNKTDICPINIFSWDDQNEIWGTESIGPFDKIPTDIFIADANNDGENDILVVFNESKKLCIYCWNDATGYWDSAITRTTGNYPSGLFVGDVNNDGANDILTANKGDSNVSMFLWKYFPAIPALECIVPNLDSDGLIDLNWNDAEGAETYSIYRNSSRITDVSRLVPLATVSTSYYTHNITKNGIYYYVIIAENSIGNSSISNCENVTVGIPPKIAVLEPILPNPNPSGVILLNWNDISDALIYYIYRDTIEITSVTNLTPIAYTTESNYTDVIMINGIYCYVIVVSDGWANSSISLWQCVEVAIPSDDGIPGYRFLTLLISLISLIIYRLKMKSLKEIKNSFLFLIHFAIGFQR